MTNPLVGKGAGCWADSSRRSGNMLRLRKSGPRDDGPGDEQLFAWAVLAPVLRRHYSVVSDPKQDIVVCACSPERRRTLLDWARHVSDEVARKLG